MTGLLLRRDRPAPTTGDLALGAGLLVVAVLSGLFIDAAWPDTTEPSVWWQWALVCTPPVLVAFRRFDPIAVTLIATAAQAAIWVSDLPEVLLSMIVILYTAAAEAGERGLRVAVAAGVVLTAVTAVGVRVADDVTVYQLPLIVLTCGTAIALGVHADRRRTEAGELAAEVAELRVRSEYERAAAIADERNHIARELHDIIGHSLSTIAVRAEAADRVAGTRPEAAHDAVTAIAAAARSALTDTRRVLDGLRRADDVDLSPPPDVDSIRRMVDDLVDAGVDVTLTTDGCDEHSPPAVVCGGAHRIVQESLTNAIRHAGPGSTIAVTLTCRNGMFDIAVVDDGQGRRDRGIDSTGSGLTGMAERAAVLGGTFSAGDRPDGGFAVHAQLPSERTPSDPAPTVEEQP